MDKKIAIFSLCALIAIFVIPSVIRAASFDCSKASTKTEKAICNDPILSKLDEDMAAAYSEALKTSDSDAIKKEQRKWLKEVLASCIEDKVCIKKAYENRLRQLESSVIAKATPSKDSNITGETIKSIERLSLETAKEFALRNTPPNTGPILQVIETNEWSKDHKSIIAFYELNKVINYPEIVGYLFFPQPDGKYRKLLIRVFESEGGDPEIREVFFEKVGSQTKLFIICAWEQLLHYDYSGTFYSVYVFNPPSSNPTLAKLQPDQRLTKMFDLQCDCSFRDGRTEEAKYNTAAKVRKALRDLNK